ncbi:hypothetical protein HELRODRAFT_178647 [Helobdella robusta]|uniref:Uncharacterized protein n=1 Tax=Helobdella robusta TaxID=6412 RepID=T1FDI0_HELRO|nr:hypothetical protein HELRODRAFT_178647 [Helobdella robusta]ESN96847.1 hypothetical protein HELRODRAFT_178647 [Helobdella robusta]
MHCLRGPMKIYLNPHFKAEKWREILSPGTERRPDLQLTYERFMEQSMSQPLCRAISQPICIPIQRYRLVVVHKMVYALPNRSTQESTLGEKGGEQMFSRKWMADQQQAPARSHGLAAL